MPQHWLEMHWYVGWIVKGVLHCIVWFLYVLAKEGKTGSICQARGLAVNGYSWIHPHQQWTRFVRKIKRKCLLPAGTEGKLAQPPVLRDMIMRLEQSKQQGYRSRLGANVGLSPFGNATKTGLSQFSSSALFSPHSICPYPISPTPPPCLSLAIQHELLHIESLSAVWERKHFLQLPRPAKTPVPLTICSHPGTGEEE